MLGMHLMLAVALLAGPGHVTIDFGKYAVGKPPVHFTTARTGRGAEGAWVVVEDAGKRVLAQTSGDTTGYRFPVCVYDGFSATDVDVSVRFRPISGQGDQAAGIVWRYQDVDNYYIVRANALENNVVLYKVEKGRRTDLPLKGVGRTYGMKAQVPSGKWGALRVKAVGSLFTVFCNGKQLYEVEDTTFIGAGKVGVWTKADSVTHFADLKMSDVGGNKVKGGAGKDRDDR
jgi:hypothetical protein